METNNNQYIAALAIEFFLVLQFSNHPVINAVQDDRHRWMSEVVQQPPVAPDIQSSAATFAHRFMVIGALKEACGRLQEEEFHARSAIVSEAQRVYASIAYRCIAMLESDAAIVRRVLSKKDDEDVAATPSRERVRSARSVTPPRHADPSAASPSSSAFVPTGKAGHFYMSAAKIDHTDPRLAATPTRRCGPDQPPRPVHISRLELPCTYQSRRRECVVKKLSADLEHQSKVVRDLEISEARRAEAFRRREAALLQKAVVNETRNTTKAMEHTRMQLKDFEERQPLRLNVEEKREATRIHLKRTALEQQARARASRFMDLETSLFVDEAKKVFNREVSQLLETAHAVHRSTHEEESRDRKTLDGVLIDRRLKRGAFQRTFKKLVEEELERKRRVDHEDIAEVVASRHPEPVGAAVAWTTASPDEGAERVRAAGTPSPHRRHLRDTESSSSARRRAAHPKPVMPDATYARLCGMRESIVRGFGLDSSSNSAQSVGISSNIVGVDDDVAYDVRELASQWMFRNSGASLMVRGAPSVQWK